MTPGGNQNGEASVAESIVSLEVVNYKQELKRIEKEALELADAEIEDLAEYATKQLTVVTPVDTGEARRGWKLNKNGDVILIINEVEHIVYLNNGHSKQAPQYFIEQVLSTIGLLTPN